MKRATIERNFRKIKNQIGQIEEIARHSRVNTLWEHDAAVRKKLKAIREYENEGIKDYEDVYESYLEILRYISERLIEDYNRKNNTSFSFESIIEDNYDKYLSSGIMAVLFTEHIPRMVSSEFDMVFPSNPKDEYIKTRGMKRKFYLHLGETNTGKTYNAMKRLKEAGRGIYLSPLRILALENYEKLNNEGIKCNLLTGEEEIIVEGASHISCTIEKLNIDENYDIGIIDEIQMINDDQRGAAWTRAVLGLKCREIHICGAINARDLLEKIIRDCGDEYEIIEYKRDIPLVLQDESFHSRDVQPGDALVVFSKKRVLELASYYSNINVEASLIYGDLPPEVRRKQYDKFINKESTILISTDAIGMGVNLPIKRIVFMDIKKYDGSEVRYLTSQEVKQIAGRAGRKGIYDTGYVSYYGNAHNFIDESLETEDREIEEGVIGPSEAILKIRELPLREKMALWSTRQEKVYFYRKMDITEYLIVLDSIKKYKLDERIQWTLLKIPFDVSNPDIMNTFLSFVDQRFISKSETISKPQNYVVELRALENYYQKINLYYSFSRAFNLDFDLKWIYDERIKVSNEINNLLNHI